MALLNEPFSLNQVLSDLVAQFAFPAQEKGLELLVDCPLDLPDELIGDTIRLHQILLNLINNAIKFTHQGEVVVSLSLSDRTENSARFHFCIRDTGIGIEKDLLPSLFDAFMQADNSMARQFGGTGLGLSICKRLTELMNGKIAVKSEKDKGTEFIVTLPFEIASPRKVINWLDEKVKREIKNKSALIVEQKTVSVQTMSKLLEQLGMSVQVVRNVEDALDYFNRRTFDLIFIDRQLPEMTEPELAEAINELSRYSNSQHIVLLTDYESDYSNIKNNHHAQQNILFKPVTNTAVFNLLNDIYGITKTENIGTYQQQSMDLDDVKILLVEDNEVNLELAEELLSQGNANVTSATTGQEAIEAIQLERFDVVLMDCHMPVMNGYQASRYIRNQLGEKHLPIIALTANTMAGDREVALEAGMNDHIGKPIHVEELFAVIRKWLFISAKANNNPLYESQSKQTDTAILIRLDELNCLDIQKGLAITNNNPALYQKLLIKFVDIYKDFNERMSTLIKQDSIEELTLNIHSLRGAANSLGADDISQSAGELETLLNNPAASKSAIQHKADKVFAAMQTLISAFNQACSLTKLPHHEKELSVEPEPTQRVEQLINQLEKMLHANNTKAEDYIELLLQSNLHEHKINKNQLQEMLSAIQRYDFERAEQSFKLIKNQYSGSA